MALIELIDVSLVRVPLAARDKEGVVKELVAALVDAGKAADAKAVLKAILDRESLGSTGLEDGIAVPHGKTDAVADLCIAIGISPDGVGFGAMDGKLSRLFFMIVAPPDKSGPHIQALSEIARLSRSKALCRAIMASRDANEAVALIKGE